MAKECVKSPLLVSIQWRGNGGKMDIPSKPHPGCPCPRKSTVPHPPSTDKNKWQNPATKATYKIEKILFNKRILGDVKKLSPLYQTSALEGFHSLILRFAPKNVAFSYLVMLCRLYLAAFHFNENSGRSQARTAAGELRFQIKFPKAKRGGHVVSMVKTKYTTEYVSELMDLLFNKVIHDPGTFAAELRAVAVPGFLCSQYERPEKADAIARHVSRFSCPGGVGAAPALGGPTSDCAADVPVTDREEGRIITH
ncbi:uncharacterized protein LOC126387059 [Epinephelus moara]|uniref:uncharacterized protein LOC126387059 n=1 Tax=Epinephelus moara TaxID=300413 RepID=UPI00214EF849|nr:uncharacterized protein LOC126387059 [Epinephelus moara]